MPNIVATIRKGYRVTAGNTVYHVIGSRSLRGVYYYVLERAFDGKKFSMRRDELLKGQQDGQIVVALAN